jgi:hypothetical protein
MSLSSFPTISSFASTAVNRDVLNMGRIFNTGS